MIKRWRNLAQQIWAYLRYASGDDAYERYLTHWQMKHAGSGDLPLDKKAFYVEETKRKWAKTQRCC